MRCTVNEQIDHRAPISANRNFPRSPPQSQKQKEAAQSGPTWTERKASNITNRGLSKRLERTKTKHKRVLFPLTFP